MLCSPRPAPSSTLTAPTLPSRGSPIQLMHQLTHTPWSSPSQQPRASRALVGPDLNDLGCHGHTTPDGTVIVAGGYAKVVGPEFRAIRQFKPLADFGATTSMGASRFRGAAHRLPDGNLVFLGGSSSGNDADDSLHHQPTYERMIKPPGQNLLLLPLLANTLPYDLYPVLHLLPSGTFFLFANSQACEVNLTASGTCLRTFPNITIGSAGPAMPRSHPYPAASVLQVLGPADGYKARITFCGGGSPPTSSCGTISPSDASPANAYESMPGPRTMSAGIILPTSDILFVNGAANGSATNNGAQNPVLTPYLLDSAKSVGAAGRFVVLSSATQARMFQASALLDPNARVILAGGNPVQAPSQAKYVAPPASLSVEAFIPPYLQTGQTQPAISSAPTTLGYGQLFTFTLTSFAFDAPSLIVVFIDSGFSTHGLNMGQRGVQGLVSSVSGSTVSVVAPPNAFVAPPGYYMMFAVPKSTTTGLRVPSKAVWVQVGGVPAYPPPPPASPPPPAPPPPARPPPPPPPA
eukprot:SM001453S01069  [mRNA]  locus=s1453:83:2088:+ [translate_table: standard]